MSAPLIINVRSFLPDAASPSPDGDFSEKVFHELMHTYVMGLTENSALRKKYENEPPSVLNHLHVMALEKFVLLKLGKTAELAYLEQEYKTDTGAYRRAWEIVGEEGWEVFLRELKGEAVTRKAPVLGVW